MATFSWYAGEKDGGEAGMRSCPAPRGDEAWKMLLSTYLPDFLDFFFPALGRVMERDRYDFLDGELQSLSRRIGTGKRIADRLVQVYLRDCSETWLLVHKEEALEGFAGKEPR